MIIGTGIDAVAIDRILKLGQKALEKIYNPKELEEYRALENAHEDVRAQFLASRFAVKEAYAKARGTGFCETVVPSDIYTQNEEDGRPYVVLKGKTLDNAPRCAVHLSITHEKPLAIAIVILETEENTDVQK